MAKESIDTIISQEALEQFLELGKRLDDVYAKMESLIGKVFDLNKAMSAAGGAKDAAEAMNNQNKAAEELNQTNSKRLDIERKISEEGRKMAMAVKDEVAEVNKLQLALTNASKDQRETSIKINELSEALKKQKEALKNLNKDYSATSDKKGELIEKIQKTQIELTKEKNALKLITQELTANEGSHEQLSAQLAILTRQYNELDVVQRDSTEGGMLLLDQMNRLSEALKGLEEAHGVHARSVGEYEKGQTGATQKTETLRATLRNLKNDLAQQMMALEKVNGKIKEQQSLVVSLATSKGKESEEYKTAAAELEILTEAQNKAAQSIQTLQEEGAKLQDIYGDASSRVKALSSDFSNTDAAVQGVGVMIDAYTVLQSSMVALGVESDALMDIFAKLMILQQGINSVSQITKALQSESILRTKLEAFWMNVKQGYQKRMLASQIANTTATAAGNVASGASVGIFKKVTIAIKAMNKALMANPWMLLAAAIIAAVAGLIKFISNQKAEKVEALNKVIEAQTRAFDKHSDQVSKNVDKMKALGMSEEQILQYRKAAIKMDYYAAKATMERMKANKNATQEQLNAVTEAYNTQNKLYRDILHEEEVLAITSTHNKLQKIKEEEEEAEREAEKKAEDKRKKNAEDYKKKIEDAKKFEEQLNDEIKAIEYERASDIEKFRMDMFNLETWRVEEKKKHPQQIALIEELYLKKSAKIRDEYNKKEKESLDYVESKKLETIVKSNDYIKRSYEEMAKFATWRYETEINEAIKAGVKGEELEKLKYEAKKKWHLEEIKLFELRKEELIKQGMSEEEYFAKLSQMQADGIISEQDYTDKVLQMNKQITQQRMAGFQEMVGGFASLGSAIAQNIQDEKQRMKVETAIALAQALVNEGIAIAEVINEDWGDPYTKAFRIAASVSAIVAAMTTATAAFSKASAAIPYAEGTDYHKGGAALIGEAGEPEIVMIKNREPFVIDKPTLIKDFPVGAKVIPMHKADNVMSMTETNELLKAIKNKATVNVNVSDEITTYIQSKLNLTKVIGGYFKA